jgi:hypothetical protein
MAVEPSDQDKALARTIRATAAQFEAVFERARPLAAGPDGQIAFGSLSDGNSSTEDKIARAIAHARPNGWLHKLIEQYVTGGEAEGGGEAVLSEARKQQIIQPGSTLESLSNVMRGFQAAGIQLYHFSRAMRQVCRIDIDGNPKGTGFLVRPHIVMTAYHVIRPLTELVPQPAGPESANGAGVCPQTVKALPDTAKRIRIVFDDIDVMRNGHRERLPGFTVPVAGEWLEAASPCHKLELEARFPEDFSELSTQLDYALIRLDGIARIGIPPVTVRKSRVATQDAIIIFQHPDGRALSIDRASVIALCGDWRFEHDVNTQQGSSGSPCFDSVFDAVGIHQAGRSVAGANRTNRAVPLLPILPEIDKLPAPDPRLLPMSDLTEGEPGHPVLGRADTQLWVWRQLDIGDRPILAIWGEAGRGKSFTYDMLRSLLPRGEHDVVKLAAVEDIQKHTPESFAALLLKRLGYPPMPPIGFEANTERPRWLKDTYLPALLAALEAGRANAANVAPKGVWIVIDDIEKAAIGSSTEISDYLFRLYAAARERKWLHFVLLGYDGALPEELKDLSVREELVQPTDEDLKNYLRTKLPPTAYAASEFFIGTLLMVIRKQLDEVPRARQLHRLQLQMAEVARHWRENAV